jgi:hypothetical protein
MVGNLSECYVPTISSVHPVSPLVAGTAVDNKSANLVLEGTVERKHLAQYYADQPIGVMIIRGENVVLLGEIVRRQHLPRIKTHMAGQDLDAEDEVPLQGVSLQELDPAYKREVEIRKKREAEKSQILFEGLGFSKSGDGDGY